MAEYAISALCISLMVSLMALYSGVMKASSRSTPARITLAATPHQGASGSAEAATRERRIPARCLGKALLNQSRTRCRCSFLILR